MAILPDSRSIMDVGGLPPSAATCDMPVWESSAAHIYVVGLPFGVLLQSPPVSPIQDRFGHGQHRFDNGAEHLLGIGTHTCGHSKQPSRGVVVDLALTVGSVTETVEVKGPGRSKTTAG